MHFIKPFFIASLLFAVANINAGSAVTTSFDFYGHPININYDQQILNLNLGRLDQSEISSNLKLLRNSNLTNSVFNLNRNIKHFNLDDISVILLIEKFANKVTKYKTKNERNFVKYLILKELGFDVLLTRTENENLNCLGNLSFTPSRYIYINYANKVYKDLDFKNRTNYKKHLILTDPKRTFRSINRNVFKVPKVDAKLKFKHINFKFKGAIHEVEAVSNESLTDYLADLPMFEVGKDFIDFSISSELNTSVISYLKNEVEVMSKVDATKFLLAFVQQVSSYGSDYVKYGEERFYYPEETIMAANADCEDKAMLLAYLTKHLINVKTVALYFENDEHLSLAINLPDYSLASSFRYKGNTFIPCEPTAKYPHLGQSQFALKRVTEVIEF